MAQLDLFGSPITQTVVTSSYNEPQSKPQELIEVFTLCKGCGHASHLAPHIPIHTKEYMEENWENKGENQWVVIGFCSRQCKLKYQNSIIAEK